MDKTITKLIADYTGVRQAAWQLVAKAAFARNPDAVMNETEVILWCLARTMKQNACICSETPVVVLTGLGDYVWKYVFSCYARLQARY